MIEMAEQSDKREAPDQISDAYLIDVVRRWREEVEEIMVHTFDFLYFYGQQVDYYLNSIWRSWDTIPHLNSRVADYLLRTLCVAASRYLDSPNTFRSALEDAKRALTSAANALGAKSYVRMALSELEDYSVDSKEVEEQIQVRLGKLCVGR
jgi:hypothetical protein